MKPRVLIIRLSSFGDIVQCLSVPAHLKKRWPDCEIHWVVRSDLKSVLELSPFIDQIWELDRKSGLSGLLNLAKSLRSIPFTHIYDAHSSLRSHILSCLVRASHFLRRPKYRWKRFLQFRLGRKQFPTPYPGISSFLLPLVDWGFSGQDFLPAFKSMPVPQRQGLPKSDYVTLVPSAAWPNKRWPVEHWLALISKFKDLPIVLLGGPEDRFIEKLKLSEQVLNFAGKLSLIESCQVVAHSRAVVSADTGLLHVADQFQVPTLALIGPTAFGYPSSPTTKTLEVELECKPCSKDGRDPCRNATYQKCMIEIGPDWVLRELRSLLK